MRIYMQDEFNAFEIDEYGYKVCPSGDYTLIKNFDDRCSFGDSCSFSERCSFEGLTNAKYVAVDRIGSENRKTYFFKGDEGYFARTDRWFGSFDDFEKRVKDVHKGTIHEKTYLMALELAKVMLEQEE